MSIYLYILVMALTTYLIRALPLTVFRGKIKNRFVRSFLAYVPCACLAAMTFPAILYATGSLISGAIGLAVAISLAFLGKSLVTVAACSCAAVYVVELVMRLL
jgi:branched-subunit amino acid transport protein